MASKATASMAASSPPRTGRRMHPSPRADTWRSSTSGNRLYCIADTLYQERGFVKRSGTRERRGSARARHPVRLRGDEFAPEFLDVLPHGIDYLLGFEKVPRLDPSQRGPAIQGDSLVLGPLLHYHLSHDREDVDDGLDEAGGLGLGMRGFPAHVDRDHEVGEAVEMLEGYGIHDAAVDEDAPAELVGLKDTRNRDAGPDRLRYVA